MSRVRSARPQRRAPRDRSRSGRSGIWTHSRMTSPRRKNAWRGAPAGVGSSRMRRSSRPAASSVAGVRARSGEKATTWSITVTPLGCWPAAPRGSDLEISVGSPSSSVVSIPRNDHSAIRFPASGSSRTRTLPMSQLLPSTRKPRLSHRAGESATTISSTVTGMGRVLRSRDSMRRMRGITVVGCGLDSGETLVATAVCPARVPGADEPQLFVTAALGAAADAAPVGSEHVFRTAASPAIAARHAGEHLDPATLVRSARAAAELGVLVAAAPGGLLAPLTEHYSNRDFARELGLPLVVVARGAGGVAGQVRLVGEAARAAGLPVVAVVLTGWPDPPNRVQLDERDLLTKLARVPVLTLAEAARSTDALGEAAEAWPLHEWLTAAREPDAGAPPPPSPAAPAPAPASASRGTGEAVLLDEYDSWQPRQVGDPRSTPRPQIMQAMLEIIGAEGPMTASRAYALYNRASGGRKLTSVARAPLSSAVYWLARKEKITLTREAEIPWQGDDMVRLPDQPAVRVSELGTRTLDEVPLDEIAELVKLLRHARGVNDPTELKRAILSTYGLVRLTGRADDYLGLA